MAYSPWIGNLTVAGMPGNYGTVKLLLDETHAGSSLTLPVSVEVAAQGLSADDFQVQIFTNLNRRDFAKLAEPVSESGDAASSYWLGYTMRCVGANYDNLVYEATLPVLKCGAYRLTARYRRLHQNWWWHNDFTPAPGAPRQRDCAIVVSPEKTAALRIYEANALTVEATQGGSYENRSTLDDFLPTHDFDGFNPFQLDYVRQTLGFNVLWLMPVFPHTRWRWNRDVWSWTSNDNPGSPYAARDYWSVNPWLAEDGRSERALDLFLQLVDQAHAIALDVFIDAAFNHAGRDVIYGSGALQLGLCGPDDAQLWIRDVQPTWCTRGNEFRDGKAINHYREHANNGFEAAVWAPADRLNEHVWDDANVDWFFGDYSSLGPKPGHARDYWNAAVQHTDDRGGAEDELDLFYTDLGADRETAALWTYFAHILPYWLDKTNSKLGGIRADFAQGLPNQLWEFIVNTARQKRWDFVFLAEVLDPDVVQYRLNKVFDVLTTKDHHLYRKNDITMSQLFNSLEAENRLFGRNAVIMHNGTSHDEQGNRDKWLMVARYGIAAAVYGCPMIFMGQPLGVGNKLPFRESWAEMYDAWTREDQVLSSAVTQMYRRINSAREASPELRSASRYFLNLVHGGFHENIFAVARWVSVGARDSVILVFVNLLSADVTSGVFNVPRSVRLSGDYQVVNLVADDSSRAVWPAARTADSIYDSGVEVTFSYPNEVQYLKLVPASS